MPKHPPIPADYLNDQSQRAAAAAEARDAGGKFVREPRETLSRPDLWHRILLLNHPLSAWEDEELLDYALELPRESTILTEVKLEILTRMAARR